MCGLPAQLEREQRSVSVTIRTASADDLGGMVEILEQLFSIEEDFKPDRGLQIKGLKLLLENNSGCLLVAKSGEKVVGMCSGQILISTAEGGPCLMMEDLVVHENYRGHGIGTRLIERLERFANSREISRVQLLADRNNTPALKFYEKNGWKTTSLICLRERI
ncbi:GNAT family N-acetyltransferase [Maridesulfovibrio bastinii]|uniref:GNAT family N-acetyltransferase n=1 Tax=Maridesulfovibrio bastinii TaxID=47157 RepID=UPI0006841278|nr:GNAT family N-acetyltransferase [Maridesulfovibrio bastinii]